MSSNLHYGTGKMNLNSYMLLWVACVSNRQAYIMFIVSYQYHSIYIYIYIFIYIFIYLYTNLAVNAIVRLPHPRRGNSQGQKTILAPYMYLSIYLSVYLSIYLYIHTYQAIDCWGNILLNKFPRNLASLNQ